MERAATMQVYDTSGMKTLLRGVTCNHYTFS